MTDQIVEQAFIDLLQAVVTSTDPQTNALIYPVFTPPAGKAFNFYTSDESGTFKLPNMSAELPESTPLHAGTCVSQGTLTIWTETQVDDEPDIAVHNARADAVVQILRNVPAVVAAINAGGKVKIFGYAVGRMSRALKDRHRTFGVDLMLGFGPPDAPA